MVTEAIAIPTRSPMKRRVLAQVARHGEHRLGGSDGVVEAALGDLGPKPHLKGPGQGAHLLHLGKQQCDPIGLQLQQDLPVGIVEPGGPVGLAQRVPAVFLQLLHGQLLERHGQQLLAALKRLLVEEEFFCSIIVFM